ncbi:MAG: Fic family protein [Candidatus Rokubacteria bacterium]|nr:Fic family protein [Candidatus Rokubacteria bacterium]
MMSFRGGRLARLSLPAGTVWLLTDIAEAKGRQDLYAKQAPQVLRALRETAIVQSVESSNRIEGVTVPADRLRPLVVGRARPRDRSEEEIQGYRRALELIHTQARNLPVTPDALRRLHRIAQHGAADAGQWKRIENEIVEYRQGAPPIVRFRPVSAAETPAALEELCLSYRHAMTQESAPPLVALATLVLDFLCIHPFRDGNGRVARLLTLLALYHHGYEVGRYISLERVVEESKDEYYEALFRSSQGWHEGQHDVLPWLNYFLAVVRRAYRELEERVGQMKTPRGAKTALVEAAIEGFPGEFTLGDLERACPGVSRDMIRRVLRDLQKAGHVMCVGRGPGAPWRKKGNTLKRG